MDSVAKKACHDPLRNHHRRNGCISRLRVAPQFAALLIEASKGASVRMPDGPTGSEFPEWFSLPWDKAISFDQSFAARHMGRAVVMKGPGDSYREGTRGTVVGIQIGPPVAFMIETADGRMLTVPSSAVLFRND
jgi:hypothetical protein